MSDIVNHRTKLFVEVKLIEYHRISENYQSNISLTHVICLFVLFYGVQTTSR